MDVHRTGARHNADGMTSLKAHVARALGVLLIDTTTPDDERLDVLGRLMADMIRQAGKRREDVAESLGVAPRTLGRWLAGEYRPSRAMLVEFAKLMECDDFEIINELLRAAGFVQVKADGRLHWRGQSTMPPAGSAPRVAERPADAAIATRSVQKSQCLRDIMTPASEIVWISAMQTAIDAAWLMLTAKHRRLLVYDADHKPCGYVPALQILDELKLRRPRTPVAMLMKALTSFMETQPVDDALLAMSQADVSIATVLDDKGVVIGMVTTKDFSEALRSRSPA